MGLFGPSLGVAACSADGGSDSGPVVPRQTGGAPALMPFTLSFEGTTIPLRPRTDAEITVRIQPPAARVVRFSLLDPTVGAALSRNEVLSGPDGRASVILTTPSSPTRFALRAQVESVEVTTTISVDAGALTTLNVVPTYSGRRGFSTWTASVFPAARCTALNGALADGPFLVRATVGSPLRLADVPASGPLAVVVRADGVAQGCTTLESPTPNGEVSVAVRVSDVPLDLGGTVLDLVLGVRPDDPALKAELQTGAELVQAVLRGPSDSEATTLLDTIAAALASSELRDFNQARVAGGWDETLPAALGWRGNSRLNDAIARWLRDGQGALLSSQAIQARIMASAGSPGVPSLVVLRVAGALAVETSVSASGTSWSVDPQDTLAFSASISWPATSLACAVVTPAAAAETGSSALGSALSRALSCDAVATQLTTTPSAWANRCTLACNVELCTRALSAQIEQACGASRTELSTLSLLATGNVEVRSDAPRLRFAGTWVGRLTRGDEKASTQGSLLGATPRAL